MGCDVIAGINNLYNYSPENQSPAVTPPPLNPQLIYTKKKQAPEASACFHNIDLSVKD